jgi:hypothetical protein
VVILPGGDDGLKILNIVEEWTHCWMLKPAFWVYSSESKISEDSVPRITSCVIGRNGRREIDLLDYLSREDFEQVRLIAIRTVDELSEHDALQDKIIDQVKNALDSARPLEIKDDRVDRPHTKFVRVNLVFAPTSRKGASALHLLEPSWDVNLVVAPEDRSTPSRFDKATRDVTAEDKDIWHRFILSNAAAVGGIWAGQEKGILDSAEFQDLSPIQGQVRLMRSFIRGILSEGLATRVAADALDRAAKAELSKIDPLRPFPNETLEAYESANLAGEIKKMVNYTMGFSDNRLSYKRVELLPPAQPKETGVFTAINEFFKTSWSLLKILPLWFFAGIWNAIARFVSRIIFGFRGRKVVKGSIDFPQTNLDKGAEIMLTEIARRRKQIAATLAVWPHNVLRKSEPILWAQIRRLVVGRLDASVLPDGVLVEAGTRGKLVVGNLNEVIPNVKEEWVLPENLERTLPSQPRSATWLQDEVIDDLTQFISGEIAKKSTQIDELRVKITQADEEKVKKEEELTVLIGRLESLSASEVGSTHA